MLPPLYAGDVVEDVSKLDARTPDSPKTPLLGFMPPSITQGILTLAFISAVFTGFLLASTTYSNISTITAFFDNNHIVISHGLRVNEAAVVKATSVLNDAVFDYFYGFLP